jgi:hypothetical protein
VVVISVKNDVFQFFFVASSAVSLGVFFFGVVPFKLGKYVMSFIRSKRGVQRVG